MFRMRLLTTLVLLPLVFAGLFYTTQWQFELFMAAIMLLAAWEYARLSGWQHILARLAYVGVIAFLLVVVSSASVNHLAFLVIVFCLWFLVFFWVKRYPALAERWSKPSVVSAIGTVVLTSCWLSLSMLRAAPGGRMWVLYLLMLIWAADSGAYGVGKLWGKRHFVPAVSPGKTLEGVLGGLLSVLLVAVATGVFFGLATDMWLRWLLLAIIVMFSALLGDLFESMLKREQHLKDSGCLLPGHGGVLDRIDSLLAAAPVFVLFWLLLWKSTWPHF